MNQILKYPRTPHITGSRIQPGDEDLRPVARETLGGLHIVVEEKLDGSNCGVSFDAEGRLILQSRGHVLSGGPRERQFDLLKRWASHHVTALGGILGRRYVMYGEWLYARHTIPYDELPHYFLEFDVLDRESGAFLSTDRRQALLHASPVVSVPVLAMGQVADFESLLGPSTCSASEKMEGLYFKHEEQGRVVGRFKYVRPSFLQAVVDSGEHWSDRPIEPNRLRRGVDLFP
ncbi:RNA ligase family protein [Paludibaculum fermentans]|uniref:RNA ligase family protein n=1 Tax=Paludibaculum fermentans TaxID=1473598 RepID=UPI003EBBB30C